MVAGYCVFQQQMEVVPEEDVVAQDEGAGIVADELLADDEGLGETIRRGLYGVAQIDAPAAAVPRSCSKRGVSWGVEMMRMSRIPASMRVLSG